MFVVTILMNKIVTKLLHEMFPVVCKAFQFMLLGLAIYLLFKKKKGPFDFIKLNNLKEQHQSIELQKQWPFDKVQFNGLETYICS